MSDEQPIVERREILEERGNRDAFHLAVMLFILLLALVGVMGVFAWRVNVILMPLMRRESVAPPQKTFSTTTAARDSWAHSHETKIRPWIPHSSSSLCQCSSSWTHSCEPVPPVAARVLPHTKAITPRSSAEAAGSQHRDA